jgi:hypothetical protein
MTDPRIIDCPECSEPASRGRDMQYRCSRCGWWGEEPALDRQHRLILERRKSIRGQLAEHDARVRSEPTRDFGMLGHALREQVFWLDSLDVLFTHAKTKR